LKARSRKGINLVIIKPIKQHQGTFENANQVKAHQILLLSPT